MRACHLSIGLIWILGTVITPAFAGEPVHVLVANDDGIDSPGLVAIAAVLVGDPGYRVTVVAPKTQQSVSGHALITRREVEVSEHQPIAGATAWVVDATPATVARVALTALLVDDPPDLVVSGINRGENDGLGAWTSGTVAVARPVRDFDPMRPHLVEWQSKMSAAYAEAGHPIPTKLLSSTGCLRRASRYISGGNCAC